MAHRPSLKSDAALVVDRLRKTYAQGDDTTVALDDISLHVECGEVVGLLGPNGAGKSTLVNILSTLLHPTAGSATVVGYDVGTDVATVRHNIGVVFQEPALDEQLTGTQRPEIWRFGQDNNKIVLGDDAEDAGPIALTG